MPKQNEEKTLTFAKKQTIKSDRGRKDEIDEDDLEDNSPTVYQHD